MPNTDWSGTEDRLSEMETGGWDESLTEVRRNLRGCGLVILFGALFWIGIFFAYLYISGR